jgi:oligo-1,6-glucosidase
MPGVTVSQAREFTDPSRGELDMVFQFEHVQLDRGDRKWDPIPLSLPVLKASLAAWQVGLADVGWNSLYWDNHDQPRAVSRFGDDGRYRVESATLLATVLHLHRGTPYVFQGEELGMTNADFTSIEDYRDIESLNHYAEAVSLGERPQDVLQALRTASRDNARTPMQWDATKNAGFTTGTPWIDVNANAKTINAKDAVANPDSVFHYYRRLIALRHDEPVVAYGRYALLAPKHEQLFAFTRTLDDEELLVLANFSASALDPATLLDSSWSDASLVIANYPEGPATGVLRPWEARVLRRRNG